MTGCGRVAVSMATLALVASCSAASPDPEPAPSDATSPMPRALDTPSASATPVDQGTTVDIVIEDGSVTPTGDRVEIEVGEPVTLRVDSDASDEIHVHSDPEHEFAVVPGPGQSFTFTVEVPGQVAVESHELDRTVVQLLVR